MVASHTKSDVAESLPFFKEHSSHSFGKDPPIHGSKKVTDDLDTHARWGGTTKVQRESSRVKRAHMALRSD